MRYSPLLLLLLAGCPDSSADPKSGPRYVRIMDVIIISPSHDGQVQSETSIQFGPKLVTLIRMDEVKWRLQIKEDNKQHDYGSVKAGDEVLLCDPIAVNGHAREPVP